MKPKATKHFRQRFLTLGTITILLAGMACAGYWLKTVSNPKKITPQKTINISQPKILKPPQTLSELLALKPAELKNIDGGLMNLLCAGGLRGAENLSVEQGLKQLDEMASWVKAVTQRHAYKFHDHPEDYRNSEGYFQMLYLVTVLQEDFGIHYNPDRMTPVGVFEPNSVFFSDSRDVFIHGMIDQDHRTGTCASMPVLYVAVGRRLGYPLKLVPTKNHLFIRWEDRRERFNIDGTAEGLDVYDDEKYREWPFPVSGEEEKEFGYLKSMTPAEELRVFLSLRGHCLLAMGKLEDGLAIHEAALRVAPNNREQQLILAEVKKEIALRRAQATWLPPEQLSRGNIPVDDQSHAAEVSRIIWQAQQLSRAKRGQSP